VLGLLEGERDGLELEGGVAGQEPVSGVGFITGLAGEQSFLCRLE